MAARASKQPARPTKRATAKGKSISSQAFSAKTFPFKKAAAIGAALLLVVVVILVLVLTSDAYAPQENNAASTTAAQQAQANNAQDKSSTSKTPGEPKKTAAGNQAVTHMRTAEERMASSDSANDAKPGPKTVYLTFDDGPSPNTPRILEILAEYGVQATWFVKGDQPQIAYVKDIWEANNQVAIHTYTHNYKQVYASADSYWDDLHQAGSAIKDQIGFEPTLVRFPGGSHNSFNGEIANNILDRMAAEHYHYFDWNVSSGDGGDHDAAFIENYVVEQAQGCHSCCVLMHDSAAKDTTVEALPTIIEWFIDNGFEFDVLLADSFGYHF